ncbi:MAG: Calx-beta domain-containing protein, partial [Pseudomonadota bacterium]
TLPASISIDDISVDETAGTASFSVSLAQVNAQTVTVDWTTVDGTAVAPGDYTAASGQVSFTPGQVSQPIDIVLIDDSSGEGDENFTVQLSNPSGGVLVDDIGEATIVDNELSPCGPPTIDGSADTEVFVWKDCASDTWHVAATAGGTYANWVGQLTSGAAFQNVTAIDIEGHDTFDNTVPTTIDFGLQIWGNGLDEFSFQGASGQPICIDLTTPPGVNVLVGASRTPVAAPFELDTLGACPL